MVVREEMTGAGGQDQAAYRAAQGVPDTADDSTQFIHVLRKIRDRGPDGRPRTRPEAVGGDKAHSSRSTGAHLRRRSIKTVIPEKRNQVANRKKKASRGGRSVSHHADLYKESNTVERLINKLKAWRGIATRYDKTPESCLAGLQLRASMIWIKDLTRTRRPLRSCGGLPRSGPPLHRLDQDAAWTLLKSRPARSAPTTAPLSSRVKKPRCPLKAPLVTMYSSAPPGSRPKSNGG